MRSVSGSPPKPAGFGNRMISVRALAHKERQEFADLLDGLSPQQWQAPTLCRGWNVRDGAGHHAERSTGRGREVHGRGEALLLAMTGRVAAVAAELHGPGVAHLGKR